MFGLSAIRNLTLWLKLIVLVACCILFFVSFYAIYWNVPLSADVKTSEISSYHSSADDHTETYDKNDFDGYLYKPILLASEQIPRIIHRTWKEAELPERWQTLFQDCKTMHSSYQHIIWTDKTSIDFIKRYYPDFLATFKSYKYGIQRADAIRYFVLHHYGGVYMDTDMGCRKPMDPLLQFQVIMPRTVPVGISNDLIFSAQSHPFMKLTIDSLQKWDMHLVFNYPTVMFSTGPMFLSSMFRKFRSSSARFKEVRSLPKALYGKHALTQDVPDAFFSHFYGSSWHEDDAGFILLLAQVLKYAALLGFMGGSVYLIWRYSHRHAYTEILPVQTPRPTLRKSKSHSSRSSVMERIAERNPSTTRQRGNSLMNERALGGSPENKIAAGRRSNTPIDRPRRLSLVQVKKMD